MKPPLKLLCNPAAKLTNQIGTCRTAKSFFSFFVVQNKNKSFSRKVSSLSPLNCPIDCLAVWNKENDDIRDPKRIFLLFHNVCRLDLTVFNTAFGEEFLKVFYLKNGSKTHGLCNQFGFKFGNLGTYRYMF